MPNLRRLTLRLLQSSVVWTWLAVGLRLASGVLLLPLLLRLLSQGDLGMYYVFLRVIGLTLIIDFGFSVSIGRYVSYAMGGATELRPLGMTEERAGGGPNFALLWQLLLASRQLYRYLTVAALLLLGLWGTYNVHLSLGKLAQFDVGDFKDAAGFVAKLRAQADPVSQSLWSRLSPTTRAKLEGNQATATAAQTNWVSDLNRLLTNASLYDPQVFSGVRLSVPPAELAAQSPPPAGWALQNRRLLEDAYPREILRSSSPAFVWAAWGLTLVAALFEIYLGWWNTFLRSTNQVRQSAQYTILGYVLQLAIAGGLLLLGGGLLSLPLGSLCGNTVQRALSRRAALRLLGTHPPAGLSLNLPKMLATLWPNTWRTGVQFFSMYLGGSVPSLVFAAQFGSAALPPYAVSLQLIAICGGLATVWMQVKWPLVGQYRAQHDLPALRRLLWQRFWLQVVSYLVLAAGAVVLGPLALKLIGSGKQLLPVPWLVLLALVGFLDMLFAFWTTLLSMENRIPSLWPTVATNVVTMGLFVVLLHTTSLGAGALVLAPLLAGALFNYWYWHFAGARSLGTSLGQFLVTRPR